MTVPFRASSTSTIALHVAVLACVAASVAHAAPATIPADCRDHRGGGDLVVRACADDATLRLELASKGKTARAKVSRTINPEGTFANEIVVTAFDARRVALSYDDTECSVALLVDRDTGVVRADSGCANSRYCTIPRLPAAGAATVDVVCDDGSGGTATTQLALAPPTAGKEPAPAPAATTPAPTAPAATTGAATTRSTP